MQNILVPIGISDYAEGTLLYALDLANAFKSTVYAVDAYPLHSSRTNMTNVNSRLAKKNRERLKSLIDGLALKVRNIKIVETEHDLVETIKKVDHSIGVDLIVSAPLNDKINEEIFLGRITGSLIKRTNIPVLIAPLNTKFKAPKKMLLAFKTGEVKDEKTLKPMLAFQDLFNTKLKLLLVKVPGFADKNHSLDDTLMQRSEGLLFSENATVYQGVLEHFQANKPQMLVAFKRARGFFEKLWEPDVIYKKEFYCRVPLLVLKNKD